ncbi:MAG: 2Fe-2S iron-sulfur cluster-binding protein [Hyphomicrobiaceae bacterium]
MGVINVKMPDGDRIALDAVEGWRVMEILRDHGMPISAECGGACACATCHVRISPEWLASLHPARDDEEDKLDEIIDVSPASRLSCQIIWDPTLDGLELELMKGAGS